VLLSAVLILLGVLSGLAAGWFLGDHSLHDWILSFAGAAELFGVLLIAAPELVPLLVRGMSATAMVWQRAMEHRKRIANRIRRMLHPPHDDHTYDDARTGSVHISGGGTVSTQSGPGESLEEKVEFLLRREQALQERLDVTAREVGDLPRKWQADMEATASGLRDGFATAIRELDERHIRARLAGIVLVVVGILLNTWGNLI
jgi:hypothetical protein